MNTIRHAKLVATIFDVWQHFNLPGNPRQNPTPSPFRHDRNPSFSVARDGQTFLDFATGDRGDVVTFWQRATGLPVADACKTFVAFAGGRATCHPTTAACIASHPAQHAARARPALPALQPGNANQLLTLAALRNLSMDGLRLATDRGLLRFAAVHKLTAWVVTDAERVNAQARRTDGGLWQHLSGPAKAFTLPGSWATWPIGIREAQHFPRILLVEGGPDLLAAHHFVNAEERERDVAAVAMLGATHRIHPDALPLFRGKRVRIYPHLDDAGRKAAERWTEQLDAVNADVDCFDLSGIPTTSNGRVADLNDLCHLDADAFETDRQLRMVLP